MKQCRKTRKNRKQSKGKRKINLRRKSLKCKKVMRLKKGSGNIYNNAILAEELRQIMVDFSSLQLSFHHNFEHSSDEKANQIISKFNEHFSKFENIFTVIIEKNQTEEILVSMEDIVEDVIKFLKNKSHTQLINNATQLYQFIEKHKQHKKPLKLNELGRQTSSLNRMDSTKLREFTNAF